MVRRIESLNSVTSIAGCASVPVKSKVEALLSSWDNTFFAETNRKQLIEKARVTYLLKANDLLIFLFLIDV